MVSKEGGNFCCWWWILAMIIELVVAEFTLAIWIQPSRKIIPHTSSFHVFIDGLMQGLVCFWCSCLLLMSYIERILVATELFSRLVGDISCAYHVPSMRFASFTLFVHCCRREWFLHIPEYQLMKQLWTRDSPAIHFNQSQSFIIH